MSKWTNWWLRAEELLEDASGNPILAVDRLQVELREEDIFASHWLDSPRIDMANQLVSFAITKREKGELNNDC